MTGLDRWLAPLYRALGLGQSPLVLSMSLAMLITAYVIRFIATGYNAVEAGYEKIGTKFTESSRILGLGMTRTFFKVELPLIRGSVIGGTILTFVEIVKELPLTMLLRPFNFDTLATKAYQYASDERIFQAAFPSLAVIAVGMVSILVFHQLGKRVES
jgi:iron(III) transport system permease protein